MGPRLAAQGTLTRSAGDLDWQGAWSALQQLLGRCTKDGNSNTASLYKESETKMLLSVFVGLTTDLAFLQKTS